MSELAEDATVQGSVREKKHKRRIIIFCVISLLNVGLLVLILTQLLTPATHSVVDPLVGHSAPNFTLVLLHPDAGKSSLSLSNFKGKPIVLNFWASWCQPCKEELPLLENTWKQMQSQKKNIVFLGIDFQESNSDASNFLEQQGVTYLAGLDTDGSIASKYGVTSLPQTIFIDHDGTVTSREPQELTGQELSSNLQLIL
ncbi:MAG TPA: TlpA disulfide reductase family protein [Ktedonobacteraceae bacterium]|nr:TlpA disulfide reductase family protein [Ktedonobacteraceae bacterium]